MKNAETEFKQVSQVIERLRTSVQAPSTKERKVNIAEWAESFRFQTLKDPQLEAICRAAACFVQEVQEGCECPWLVMLGNSNAGKTHLARAIFRWWKAKGRYYIEPATGASLINRGHFCYWPNFIQECKEGDSSRAEDMIDDTLVVIDDIGAGDGGKEWVAEKLMMILNNRVASGTKKATVITANLSLEQLGKVMDPRIAGRLVRRGIDRVIEVDVKDFTLRNP